MHLIGQRINIVGAGIGGLAAACALAARGARVRVFEQADAIREVGAGIQISPNGARVLAGLGVLDALAEKSPSSHSVTLRDHLGARVARLSLAGLGPFLLCHRADLIDTLKAGAEAAGVDITLGAQLTAVEAQEGEDRAALRFASGDVIDDGLVVAADGGRSILRSTIVPSGAPPFTGQVAWRAMIALSDGEARELEQGAQVFMAPGRHVVAYPLRDGRLLNLVAVEERAGWAEDGWNHPGDPERLRAAFSSFGGPVERWLNRVEDVMVWGLFKHPVAPVWARDGIVLVGDAAHPTLPFLAQGGVLALEDAWALADSLGNADSEAAGLALYQSRRIARARKVIDAADANARNYHMGGLKRRVGHMVLRTLDRTRPDLLTKRFNWLYGHDETGGLAGF